MDIAKGHNFHKIWTLLTLSKKCAEDCSRQFGSCKATGGGLMKDMLSAQKIGYALIQAQIIFGP